MIWAGLAALALVAAGVFTAWLRWSFLVRRQRVRIPTREGLRIFLCTLPAALTPLLLGELLRAVLVRRRSPRAAAAMCGTWAVERLSDAGALLVLWGAAQRRPALLLGAGALLLAAPGLWSQAVRWTAPGRLAPGDGLRGAAVAVGCAGLSLLRWLLPAAAGLLLLRAAGAPAGAGAGPELLARELLLGGLAALPGAGALSGAGAAAALLAAVHCGFPALLGALLAWHGRAELRRLLRAQAADQRHFDALAPSYAEELPQHVRERLLDRKLDAMLQRLPQPRAGAPLRGLDLGCGQGWYLARLAQAGYAMSGVDASAGQIALARRHCAARGVGARLELSAGTALPFAASSFDFVYSINVFHHLIEPHEQERMFAEVLRVLAPGGVFFLHEMNVENPLFRFYMSYLFPLIKRIDEGTELWLRPTRLPALPGGDWLPDVEYFTFLPDFLPASALRRLVPLERWLERSSWRRYSAHYMSTLRTTPAQAWQARASLGS